MGNIKGNGSAIRKIQGSAKSQSPGLVNFVCAVAYHFCLALPAAFAQPGDHLLAEPGAAHPPVVPDDGVELLLLVPAGERVEAVAEEAHHGRGQHQQRPQHAAHDEERPAVREGTLRRHRRRRDGGHRRRKRRLCCGIRIILSICLQLL